VNNLFHLSVVSVGELRRGLVILPAGKRRTELERWFENDLLPRFHGRILAVTHSIANRWGILDGRSQLTGTTLNTADGMSSHDIPGIENVNAKPGEVLDVAGDDRNIKART
jgi:hypothetical protein